MSAMHSVDKPAGQASCRLIWRGIALLPFVAISVWSQVVIVDPRPSGNLKAEDRSDVPAQPELAGGVPGNSKSSEGVASGGRSLLLELGQGFRLVKELRESRFRRAGAVIPGPLPFPPGGAFPPGGIVPPNERTRQWTCSASCNVQQIDRNVDCPPGTEGSGTGSNEAEACREAKASAVASTPRGCYSRHCQCSCSK